MARRLRTVVAPAAIAALAFATAGRATGSPLLGAAPVLPTTPFIDQVAEQVSELAPVLPDAGGVVEVMPEAASVLSEPVAVASEPLQTTLQAADLSTDAPPSTQQVGTGATTVTDLVADSLGATAAPVASALSALTQPAASVGPVLVEAGDTAHPASQLAAHVVPAAAHPLRSAAEPIVTPVVDALGAAVEPVAPSLGGALFLPLQDVAGPALASLPLGGVLAGLLPSLPPGLLALAEPLQELLAEVLGPVYAMLGLEPPGSSSGGELMEPLDRTPRSLASSGSESRPARRRASSAPPRPPRSTSCLPRLGPALRPSPCISARSRPEASPLEQHAVQATPVSWLPSRLRQRQRPLGLA